MQDTQVFAAPARPKRVAPEAADDARRQDDEKRPEPREAETLDKYDISTIACTD